MIEKVVCRGDTCVALDGRGEPRPYFEWHLADVEQAKKLRKPSGHPQPVSFKPF